jgi:hypothetical protein
MRSGSAGRCSASAGSTVSRTTSCSVAVDLRISNVADPRNYFVSALLPEHPSSPAEAPLFVRGVDQRRKGPSRSGRWRSATSSVKRARVTGQSSRTRSHRGGLGRRHGCEMAGTPGRSIRATPGGESRASAEASSASSAQPVPFAIAGGATAVYGAPSTASRTPSGPVANGASAPSGERMVGRPCVQSDLEQRVCKCRFRRR